MSKADLSNLDLSGRDLTSAILSDANLKGAIFDDAKLTFVEWGNARCPDGTFANDNGGNCYENLLEPGDKLRPLKMGQSARVADFTVTLTSFEANASTNARVQRAGEFEPRPGNVYALIGARIRNNNTEVEYLNGELRASINGEDGSCDIDGGADSIELRKGEEVNSRLCLQVPSKSVRRGVIQINVGYDFLDNPPLYWVIP